MKTYQINFRPFFFGIFITLSLAFVILPSSSKANSNEYPNLGTSDLAYILLNAPNAPDAPPTISIDDVTVTEGNSGSINAIFTVLLSEIYTLPVSVQYTTQNNTAIEPNDYITATGSITIPAGDPTRTITITVNGDFLDEEDETFNVILNNPTNAYLGDASGLGTINDDDTAGIFVDPTAGLVTTEAGGTASFTVVLNSEPTSNVTIPISSTNTAEGTAAPASLTFTPANWNAPQTVTITGQDDPVDDDDAAYSITTDPATSSDTNYNALNAADVSVSNTDNDTAGISVDPTSGLVTTEAGGTASFTVVLDTQPTSNVTIPISSTNTAEGTAAPASLTFTTANWNDPQTVTITGQDDPVVDGDVAYSITTDPATSSDTSYNNLNAADVSVLNTDNDTAGITIDPIAGLITTEAGGTADFTVVLDSQPSSPVTIYLVSSEPSEGVASPSPLTFTSSNWNTPQTVTVTGIDDQVDDGNMSYTIQTTTSSTDSLYSDINPADVSIINHDNDTAGVTITPTSGLITTEAGGTASFSVTLESQPTTLVYIYVESSDSSEGIASPNPLTFTTGNWHTPQTVIVTGIDDPIVDGSVAYSIQITTSSVDKIYTAIDPDDVSVSNTDDDVVGITVDPISGLTTTEGGTSDSFTVRLDSQPIADVTIDLNSNDTSEGVVTPSSFTFSSSNWNSPQTATVTGQDDALIDGDVPFSIVTSPATSSDPNYNNLNASDVTVTNADDDAAGITVNPIAGLITTESGGTASFTIVLNSEPTANVSISLSSSDTSEGIVSPTSVTFTPSTWNAAQSVVITGTDDLVVDGSQAYTIITAAATSSDTNFDGQNATDVSVTNSDNDVANIAITPASGLVTSEGGTSDTFDVVLTSQPTASVIVYLDSTDTTEGTVLPIRLTFTTTNWSVAQTATITGIDDTIVDGTQAYNIETTSSSADPNYDAIPIVDVSATNLDNDSAGILVSPVSGLVTSEAGGTASFTIVLSSQPTANVSIALSSSDPSEGTISSSATVFTTSNWDTPQTIIITGEDDNVDDGDIAYSIVTAAAVSSDGNFSGQNPSNVAVTNTDNDSSGITVNPTSGLNTTEAGGTANFSIVLNSEPTQNVTIPLSSSNSLEGTVSPSSVTFTSSNWNLSQTVTVTGVDDDVVDGAQAYTIITSSAISTDPNYSNRNASNVTATNSDNDIPGINVNPTTGLVTTEAGGSANFSIVLNSEPIASVIVYLVSNDSTEGVLSTDEVTFTSANWDTAQEVTITGVNDDVMDGSQGYTINTTASSADPIYNSINPSDVSVTNSDNDTAGITVNPTTGLNTTESGGSDSFTVVLNSEPTANVSFGISSSDTTEGTISLSSVIFTPSTWNILQTVTVTGVDDAAADGDISYTINTASASSSDGNYSGINPSNVAVTNADDDAAGITVDPVTGLNTTEAGGTASFTIVLNSQPSNNVTIGLSSSDSSEGTVSPSSVVFSSSNWNSPQSLTIIGIDDDVMDGNESYTIITAAATSLDSNFDGQNAPDISVTNADDDTTGILINPSSGLITSESGGSDSFSVVLNSEPIASVIVYLNSTDLGEGTVAPGWLTFDPDDWDTPQTANITGVDDSIADGSQAYQIVTSISSADSNYDIIDPIDISVSNTDNDTAGIMVDPTSGLMTTESGGLDVFSIVLGSQPSANVTIGLSSSDLSEGTVTPSEVVFTTSNWNSPQNVTVIGVDDTIDDGDIAFSIITDAASSSDSNFSGQNPPDVSVINSDDDGAGININPQTGLITTEAGGSDSFIVVLGSQPTSNVSIGLTSSDTSEGTITPNSLTFTSSNWNVPQVATVTGIDDPSDDGDISYTIVTAAASSSDVNYSGQNPPNVSVTNQDDDTTPTAVADVYITNSGPFTVTVPGVLNNDTDVDGDSLTAILITSPLNGSLILNPNGSFVYTPNSTFNGLDIFTYQASDGSNISNIVEVEITVDQVDPIVEWDSPVEAGNTLFVSNESLLLTATASDNIQIDRVRFRRWDAINNIYVEIGIVSTSPYQITLDTTSLNYGFNQIFVEAFDLAENKSVREYIWLFRQSIINLPLVSR